MKKKWLVLIGVLLLFSLTFSNKDAGMQRVDPGTRTDRSINSEKF